MSALSWIRDGYVAVYAPLTPSLIALSVGAGRNGKCILSKIDTCKRAGEEVL
jgi:hypothetical protein